MRVIIDGNTLTSYKSGIGNYTYNLMVNMAECLPADIELAVVMSQGLYQQAGNSPDLNGVKIIPINEKFFARYLPWTNGIENYSFDLLHEPNYIPRPFNGRTVVTVCDLSHRLYPQYHPKRRVVLMRAYEGRIKQADRVITISQSSKEQIIDILGIPEDRVRVTYLAAAPIFRPLDISSLERDTLMRKYGLPERFLLYVGNIEPRKNLVRLIEAYHLFRQESVNEDVKLVLAGGKGWLYQDIYARVKELDLENDVIFTGYIEDEDLPYLYNMALAFVYPSVYEGFGLPPLEAMACGTPVITSNRSSLPEVVGDAATLIDPYCTDDLAHAICRIVSSSRLRYEMTEKALLQAAKFSWDRCAKETLAVYRDCLSF